MPAYSNILGMGIVAIVASVYLFGLYAYPVLPSRYGGGDPFLVSVILNPENHQLIGRALGRANWACMMQNITVIHENSEMFYVLPYGTESNELAVALPKKEILTYVYQRERNDQNYQCFD